MASYRASHQQKTVSERYEYSRTTIRGISPTSENELPSLSAESTDTPSVDYEDLQESIITPTRGESWFGKYKSEIIKSIISLVIISIFGGICFGIYSLNREVGVLGARFEEIKRDQNDLSNNINKIEQRLSKSIDKNASRIDRFYDSRSNPTKNSK